MSILSLQESGRLQILYNKWWRNAGSCSAEEKPNEKKASSLGVANVGGIFLMLAAGLICACIVGIGEFAWHVAQKGRNGSRLTAKVSAEIHTITVDTYA